MSDSRPSTSETAPRSGGIGNTLLRVAVSLGFLAVGFAIFAHLVRTRPVPESAGEGDAARRVVTVAALEAPVGRQWLGYGTVRPVDAADVPARVAATVASLGPGYEIGHSVQAGEVLVRLDDADFRRQLEISETILAGLAAERAALEVDERTLRETATLVEEDLEIARAELERAKAAVAAEAAVAREVDRARQLVLIAERAALSAREGLAKLPVRRQALDAEEARQRASRELSRLNLERCAIASPLDGIVQSAPLEIGESVAPGVAIARVVSLARLEVPILLPATARASVRVGDRVRLVPDRAGAEPVEGTVERIAPEDDATTRTMSVFVAAPTGAGLAPGTFVTGEVIAAGGTVRTLVPRRSVNDGKILLVREGKIESHEVDVEFTVSGGLLDAPVTDREWLVLRESLPAGTLIVLDASQRQLSDGLAVVSVPAAPAVESAGAAR